MKNKILAIVMAVLMIAAAFTVYIVADKAPALADTTNVDLNEDNQGGGLFYTLDEENNTATVGKALYAEHNTSGFEGDGSITIPDTVTKGEKTYIVTEIGRNAFDGSNVKEVIILNSVTKIGEFAFANCRNLERVAMGNGVTEIAGFAFWFCPKLVDVSLGANVKTIGGCAFWSDVSLEVITIPQGATEIMTEAFKDCVNLKVIVKADTTEPAEDWLAGIDPAPTIKNDYTPFVYVPTTYAEEGQQILVRVLLEGNPGAADLSDLTVNGEPRAIENLYLEIGDTAYNGTIFAYDQTVDADKDVTASLKGVDAAGAVKVCAHADEDKVELVTTAPTCEEKGVKDIICKKCHKTLETVDVDALDHDYVSFVIEAVCLDGGYTTKKCSRCGDVQKTDPTPATGHDWNDGVINSMPTHSSVGEKKFTCNTCKRVETVEIPVLGDINGDGSRNAKDVIALMKYLVGKKSAGKFSIEAANCSGKLSDKGAIEINAQDVTDLMKAIVDPNVTLASTEVPTEAYVPTAPAFPVDDKPATGAPEEVPAA